MTTSSNVPEVISFKYASPSEAYRAARRRIVNNALRRKQTSLDLSNFGLVELPKEIGQLSSLKNLDISKNQLTALPAEIGDMQNLQRLYAQVNKITSIPDAIERLKQLRYLNLSDNKIREIPTSIRGLSNLRQLHLGQNNIHELPREFGALQQLETLRLDDNEIASLPSEIGQLSSLTQLGLEANLLANLPKEIAQLTSLYSLDLDDNELSSLPSEISSLKRLTSLYLNGNKFSEFPIALTELPQLQYLMIANNQIPSLPASISKSRKLSGLFLGSNLLETLPPEIGTLSLSRLSVRNNRLRDLPKALGHMASLIEDARTDSTGGLAIQGNPLPAPYPALIANGQPTATENVLSWLRGEFDPATIPNDETNSPISSKMPPPPEPEEEAGPSFHIANGQIELTSSRESESDIDVAIQETIHRRLRQQAIRLREMTTRVSNQHPQLFTVADEYLALVDRPLAELDIVSLWAVGNALMAQSLSFQIHDSGRTLADPLEPAHLGILVDVASLHGGFILGFPLAVKLVTRADQSRIGPETIRKIGPATSNVLSALSRQRRVLSEGARQLIEALDSALLTGSWEAARIGYTSYATVRNALVTIGKVGLWINDKGGSLAGGVVVGSAISAASLPPDTLQLIASFLTSNAANILSFAAPFPELRTYMTWLINHFDDQRSRIN